MDICTDNTKPISGTSKVVTIGATAKTIEGHGSYSFSGLAKEVRITFDIESALLSDVLARFSRDPGFTPTAGTGNEAYRADTIVLTAEQFLAKFINTQGDIDVFVEQFELET